MNEIDKIINEINLGKFEVAFPTMKPRYSSFMVFSEGYNDNQRWNVCTSLGLFTYSYKLEIRGWDIKLTRDERKRLAKALNTAYDKELAAWKSTRNNMRGD